MLGGLCLSACVGPHDGLPRNAAILAPELVGDAFAQCSRLTPKRDGGGWRPTTEQVIALEAVLLDALAAYPEREELKGDLLNEYRRQYVGFEQNGRKLIYGNFFPFGSWNDPEWRSRPTQVCDGGPSYFGVAYDVEASQVVEIAFNGRA